MNICLFTPQEIDKPLSLRDERAQHLIKILHKKQGDTFAAGIIGGMAGTATITSLTIRQITNERGKQFDDGEIIFSFAPQSDGKLLFPLTMIIGFPRPIQLKRLLRDMAGLGVEAVHLCGTELGEKSYLDSDLATTDSGYQMLLEGTEQAASTHVPFLCRHDTLEQCVDSVLSQTNTMIAVAEASPLFITLDNIDASESLSAFLNNHPVYDEVSHLPRRVIAAIGSERGWTQNERKLLEQKGFVRLSMGSRVLRTETAATVAASIVLSAMGVLN